MGSVLAHRLGGAEVIGDALQIRVVGKRGGFQGSEAYEETILASRIREILIRDAKKPEMVVCVDDRLVGLQVRCQLVRRLDGVEYSPARRLAQEIAAINPAVAVREVSALDAVHVKRTAAAAPAQACGYDSFARSTPSWEVAEFRPRTLRA